MSTIFSFFSKTEKIVESTIPHTMGRLGRFVLTPFYTNRNLPIGKFLASSLLFGRYHGTSFGRLGDQLEKGVFADRGGKIYYDSMETAIQYALKASLDDRTMPLVLQIISDNPSKTNEIPVDGWGFGHGYQGWYSYVETNGEPVYIVRAHEVGGYEVEEVTSERYKALRITSTLAGTLGSRT